MHGITHSSSQRLIDFAYEYAKEAHGTQVRKYTGEPYITHPVAVANLVASRTIDCEMICAALLHDVIEDTDVTYDDLMEVGFGRGIAELVLELSDVSELSDGNRDTRKAIDRQHTSEASSRAKTVKLADLIHNSSSILREDKDFAKIYMNEKRLLLAVLTEGDSTLHSYATGIVENYFTEGVK